MEIKLGSEIGLARSSVYQFPKVVRYTENPGNLPNRDVTNKGEERADKESRSVKFTDSIDRYQVEGNTVNIQV